MKMVSRLQASSREVKLRKQCHMKKESELTGALPPILAVLSPVAAYT